MKSALRLGSCRPRALRFAAALQRTQSPLYLLTHCSLLQITTCPIPAIFNIVFEYVCVEWVGKQFCGEENAFRNY